MKKRYLRPSIEKLLIAITMLMLLPVFMLDDFDVSLKTFAIMLTYISILGLNIYILKTWGRGLWLDKE